MKFLKSLLMLGCIFLFFLGYVYAAGGARLKLFVNYQIPEKIYYTVSSSQIVGPGFLHRDNLNIFTITDTNESPGQRGGPYKITFYRGEDPQDLQRLCVITIHTEVNASGIPANNKFTISSSKWGPCPLISTGTENPACVCNNSNCVANVSTFNLGGEGSCNLELK